MARVSKKLQELVSTMDIDFIDENEIEEVEGYAEFIVALKEQAIYITEERELGKVLHNIEEILISVIFAILAKCNTFVEIHLFMMQHYEWLDKHVHFECGLPSLSTVKRVIGFINPRQLEEVCVTIFKDFLKKNEPLYRDGHFVIEDIKPIDGKTANSSKRNKSKNGEIAKMNAMSVYSIKDNYTEATEFIEDKTNEIPTGPKLLERINIKNCIVVFDALNTQTETLKYIIEKGGHYVAPVKGNQKNLEENIKDYFEDQELYEKAKNENYYEEKEKSHGCLEKREYIFTNDIDWIYKKSEWENIKSIGIAKRSYEDENGNTKTDIRYYISDMDAQRIKIMAEAIRKEWCIESKLHWNLDMVFMEDSNKSFLENSQKNLNIIRKFCLGLLQAYKEKSKLSLNSIRHVISMNFEKNIIDIIDTLYS